VWLSRARLLTVTVPDSCNRTVHSNVSDDDTERMRVELEGIGIGFEDFEQQAPDRFQRLAADPIV
jgi:hypothetical protein